MSHRRQQDWNPRSDIVLDDQCAAYDDMRRRCPVAWSEYLGWSLFRHEDVQRVLLDHQTFLNAASRHRSVPNGLDPPDHTVYRKAIEPYLDPARVAGFEPACRGIARSLLDKLDASRPCEFIGDFATPYSLRCQSAYVGWPPDLSTLIRDWSRRNRQATLSGDRGVLVETAREFRARVDQVLATRRQLGHGDDDVISGLMRTTVDGQLLSHEDISSILRNWTVGELASLVAALGIIVHRLAVDRLLQERLRVDTTLIPAAVEECLRTTGPLVCNRRVAARDVILGGRHVAAGDRLSLMWISANRDGSVFENPDEVRLDRDQQNSLLWGAGIHVCPGAPLAQLELRIALEELLQHSRDIRLVGTQRQRAIYPANGWEALPLTVSVLAHSHK